MKNNKPQHARLLGYAKKTLGINLKSQDLRSPLPGKSFAPSHSVQNVFSGLLTGNNSSREMEKHHAQLVARIGKGRKICRSTVANLLDEKRVVDKLQQLSDHLFVVAARNLRILKSSNSSHGIIALLDGIDLGQVHRGGGRCKLCLERKVGDEVRLYHRAVVITIMSKHGSLPLFLRMCRPEELVCDPKTASAEVFKSDCELSCAKEMLVDIAGRFGGRLPFDVIASDALMANAPFMELVEALGCAGVFIFKQENRKLYKQSKADFTGNSFAFDIRKETWCKDPSHRGRVFEAQWGRYIDHNRKGGNKKVRIFEVIRTEVDATKSTSMAIASDLALIDPRLVEEVRYAKWANLENGVFNELTKIWGTLKHLFYHKQNAIQTMLHLQFLALIAYQCYCYGNLTRGGRCYSGTVRDFFRQMTITLFSCRRITLIEAVSHSPP